jgi:hypothetical protein
MMGTFCSPIQRINSHTLRGFATESFYHWVVYWDTVRRHAPGQDPAEVCDGKAEEEGNVASVKY